MSTTVVQVVDVVRQVVGVAVDQTQTVVSGEVIRWIDTTTAAALAAHEADTTGVHGIADTSDLVVDTDARLTDARTPTAHKSSHATGGSDALSPSDIGAATAADVALADNRSWAWAISMTATAGTPVYSVGVLGASGIRTPCWLMDGASLETVLTMAAIPERWITFDVHAVWAQAAAGSGDAVLQAQYTLIEATTTLGSETNGSQITTTSGGLNVVNDTVIVSGLSRGTALALRIEVLRRGDVTADTLNSIDIGLIAVYLQRTS